MKFFSETRKSTYLFQERVYGAMAGLYSYFRDLFNIIENYESFVIFKNCKDYLILHKMYRI